MKNSTKRILTSVLTLLLTLVAVGTTTFAFFAIGDVVNLKGINGNVRSEEGLDFKLSIKNGQESGETVWRQSLNVADWQAVLTQADLWDNGPTFRLDALELKNDKLFMLEYQNDGSLKQMPAAGAVNTTSNLHYIEFTLSFRSKTEGYVNLDNAIFTGQQVTYIAEDDFNAVDGSVNLGDSVAIDSENALRVTLQELGEPGNTKTFRNSVAYETEFANGQFSYLTDIKKIDVLDENGNKYVVSNPGNNEVELTNKMEGVVLSATNDFYVELKDNQKEDEAHYYEASIVVRVWLDGWDPHTFNIIFEENLAFDLRFKKTADEVIAPTSTPAP